MTLAAVDREALNRALGMLRKENPALAERHGEGMSAAEFAAYRCQHRALKTKPWELAPCSVDEDDTPPAGDDIHREGRAIKLLRRLLRAGLSRYEPQPLDALAKMEAIEPPPAT